MQGCPDYPRLIEVFRSLTALNGKAPTQSQVAEVFKVTRQTVGQWYKRIRRDKHLSKIFKRHISS